MVLWLRGVYVCVLRLKLITPQHFTPDASQTAARRGAVALLLRLHRELGGTGMEEDGEGEDGAIVRGHLAFAHGCVRVGVGFWGVIVWGCLPPPDLIV